MMVYLSFGDFYGPSGMLIHRSKVTGFVHRFLFRNKIFSTVAGFSLLLFWLTSSLALENIHSHGTDDAGMHRHLQATFHNVGYNVLRAAQYFRGSSVLANCCSLKYLKQKERQCMTE